MVGFDEFKPAYGTSLVTGWANVHGYQHMLANAGCAVQRRVTEGCSSSPLANHADTPLIFLHNTTRYMVGAQYEHRIIKHGAMMINAVSNSAVRHLDPARCFLRCRRSRRCNPRFLFAWPSAKSAVMGGPS